MNAPGRVALVAVAHDVLRPHVVARCAAPLAPHGEASAAFAAQAASLHLVDDLVGGHGEGACESLVSAGRLVFLQAQGVDDAHILQHNLVLKAVEGVVRLMLMAYALLVAV